MHTIEVRTRDRDQFVEITSQVQDILARSRVQSGSVLVYVPHTTAGVTINENADPDVVHDMLLLQVKKPSESKEPWDFCRVVSTMPGAAAARPVAEGGCKLVRA